VLAFAGGACGLLLAAGINQLLAQRIAAGGSERLALPLDFSVLAFAFLTSLAAGVIFGTVPPGSRHAPT